jgi:hypothetical protein
MTNTQIRAALAPMLNHRVNVRGTLDDVRADYQGVRACIQFPEVEGELACPYVWVLNIGRQHAETWRAALNQQITFTAVVRDYKNKDGSMNFCLRSASEFTLVDQPPAMKIPDPRPLADVVRVAQGQAELPNHEPPCPDEPPDDEPEARPPEPTKRSKIELLQAVSDLADECGGLDKLAALVDVLRD